jgi:hypothetical protein
MHAIAAGQFKRSCSYRVSAQPGSGPAMSGVLPRMAGYGSAIRRLPANTGHRCFRTHRREAGIVSW